MTLVLNYAARSDMGLVRGNNEDSVYAGPRLLALADGMGGHAAGEVASQLAISAIAPLDNDQPGDDLLDELRRSVETANLLIRDEIEESPHLDGMGTTLVAMLFDGPKMGMVYMGDSRAYLLRDKNLHQITRDDSFVQDLVDRGRITPEEASVHPKRSLITNALMGTDCRPHLTIRQVCAGDRYLICSDGLSDPVSYDTIKHTMSQGTPQECADRLIDLALRSGGPDNVTLIVADVVDDDFGPVTPLLGGAAAKGADTPGHGIATDSAALRAAAYNPNRRATPQQVNADGAGSDSTGASTPEKGISSGAGPEDTAAAGEAGEGAGSDSTSGGAGGSAGASTGLDDAAGTPRGRDAGEAGTDSAGDAGSRRRPHTVRLSHGVKRLILTVLGLILATLIGVAATLAYTWNNSYYVGVVNNDEIVIFHGINHPSLSLLGGEVDSVLCDSAIYDGNNVPRDCVRLTLNDFTPALREELVSDKVFHTQQEARAYLTRAVASGLIPQCNPEPIIIYGPDGYPVGTQDTPDPCRKAR